MSRATSRDLERTARPQPKLRRDRMGSIVGPNGPFGSPHGATLLRRSPRIWRRPRHATSRSHNAVPRRTERPSKPRAYPSRAWRHRTTFLCRTSASLVASRTPSIAFWEAGRQRTGRGRVRVRGANTECADWAGDDRRGLWTRRRRWRRAHRWIRCGHRWPKAVARGRQVLSSAARRSGVVVVLPLANRSGGPSHPARGGQTRGRRYFRRACDDRAPHRGCRRFRRSSQALRDGARVHRGARSRRAGDAGDDVAVRRAVQSVACR